MRKLQYSKEDWEKIIDGTKTAKQVAKECQVNRQTVYHVSKKYSLPLLKDHLSYLEYHGVSAELIKKDLETMTLNDVAKKYGLDSSLLKEWCHCREIEYTTNKPCRLQPCVNAIKPKKRTGEMMDMIKYLIPVFTDASIARVFGYSREWIRQIRNKMEIEK